MADAAPERFQPPWSQLAMLGAVTLVTVVAAVAFVYFHTGARADGLCEDRVFVRAGSFSWSHFGVRCEYGFPARSSYERGASFGVLLAIAAMWLVTAVNVLGKVRSVLWARRRPARGAG